MYACSVNMLPVRLLHPCDCHIEGRPTCIQDVTSSCQEDVGAVHSKWVALGYIPFEAVESTVVGDLHCTTTAVSVLITFDACTGGQPCMRMCAIIYSLPAYTMLCCLRTVAHELPDKDHDTYK